VCYVVKKNRNWRVCVTHIANVCYAHSPKNFVEFFWIRDQGQLFKKNPEREISKTAWRKI